MANDRPDAQRLGRALIAAHLAGLSVDELGAFARVQLGTAVDDWPEAGQLLKDLCSVTLEAGKVGSFALAYLAQANGRAASVAPAAPLPAQMAVAAQPTGTAAEQSTDLASLVEAAATKALSQRRGTTLRVKRANGTETSVYVRTSLMAEYEAAFGRERLRAVAQEVASAARPDACRSRAVAQQLQRELDTFNAAASRGLKLVRAS